MEKNTGQLKYNKRQNIELSAFSFQLFIYVGLFFNATIVQPLLLSIFALVECILFPHLAGISLQQEFMLL